MNPFPYFVLVFAFSFLVPTNSVPNLPQNDYENRDIYVSQKMLVSEDAEIAAKKWSEKYIRFNANQLPSYPTWIEQPTDWDTKLYNITNMPYYNARLYWRYYSLMRHKAVIATSCWDRNTSVFTSKTIVQIYHNPGEPFRIPCYICEKRMERNGRPKVFYVIPSRNIFNVNFTFESYRVDSKVVNLQDHSLKKMSKLTKDEAIDGDKYFKYTPGPEWQIDQSFGTNLLKKGGDGLYMSPRGVASLKEDNNKDFTTSNYGTFFCLNEKAEPGDAPEVIVNVDILTDDAVFNDVSSENFITEGAEDLNYSESAWNLICKYTWYPWSCASACDDNAPKKLFRRYREGIMSIYKLNRTKPLMVPDKTKLKDYWDEWRAIEGYLSTSPYRENGIPLYSSLWFSFPDAGPIIQELFVGKRHLLNNRFLKEGKVDSTCKEKLKCENDEILSREYTYAEDKFEVDPTPSSDDTQHKICPVDILKHKEIFIGKKGGEKMELTANKAYKFFCGTERDKDRYYKDGATILWLVDKKPAENCQKNYQIHIRDNILHVHRPEATKDKQEYSCSEIKNKKPSKVGEVTVVYSIPTDWRPVLISSVVFCTVVFLTCPLCMWCARGVKDVANATKLVLVEATKLGVKVGAAYVDTQYGTNLSEMIEVYEKRYKQDKAEEADKKAQEVQKQFDRQKNEIHARNKKLGYK